MKAETTTNTRILVRTLLTLQVFVGDDVECPNRSDRCQLVPVKKDPDSLAIPSVRGALLFFRRGTLFDPTR